MTEPKKTVTKDASYYLRILAILASTAFSIYLAFQQYFQDTQQLQ